MDQIAFGSFTVQDFPSDAIFLFTGVAACIFKIPGYAAYGQDRFAAAILFFQLFPFNINIFQGFAEFRQRNVIQCVKVSTLVYIVSGVCLRVLDRIQKTYFLRAFGNGLENLRQ